LITLHIEESDGNFNVIATKKSHRLEDEIKLIAIKNSKEDAEILIDGLIFYGKADEKVINAD